MANKDFYTLDEAAKLTGRSRERIRQLCVEGKIEYVRPGIELLVTTTGLTQAKKYFETAKSGRPSQKKKT